MFNNLKALKKRSTANSGNFGPFEAFQTCGVNSVGDVHVGNFRKTVCFEQGRTASALLSTGVGLASQRDQGVAGHPMGDWLARRLSWRNQLPIRATTIYFPLFEQQNADDIYSLYSQRYTIKKDGFITANGTRAERQAASGDRVKAIRTATSKAHSVWLPGVWFAGLSIIGQTGETPRSA